jgi:cation:H+ antiporter
MEWLGKRYELSEGIVGSVLSITGTSIPQIIIPLMAFIFLRGVETIQIGIGAIIGAPFMLSTLIFFITGFTILSLAKRGEREKEIDADYIIISRDIKFFLITYAFAIFAGLLADKPPKVFIGIILLIIYGYYIYRNVVYEERISAELHNPLFFSPRRGEVTLEITTFQLISSLAGLIGGAWLFIHTMKELAILIGGTQSPLIGLILSIFFAPIVIELPSKFNSIIWLKESKDTLAFGDIISSMIFQACILVTLGILFSPWKLHGIAILVGGIPIVVTTIIYITMIIQEKLNPYVLLGSGGFYLIFILALFFI